MPCISTSIDIDAPPEEVWRVLMDPRRLGDWVTIQCDIQDLPEGHLGDGDTFRQTLALAGKKFDVRWTVCSQDEPRFAEWRAQGPRGSGARVRYELEPNGDATRFRYRNEFELPGGGVGRLAGKLSSRVAGRAMSSSLQRFRGLVESDGN
jgi:carbon monoxide dehydrogenase subunit G